MSARTSANTSPAAGMLVAVCGSYYRVTHHTGGKWYGVRMGPDAAAARDGRPSEGMTPSQVWEIPKPFIMDMEDRVTRNLVDDQTDPTVTP